MGQLRLAGPELPVGLSQRHALQATPQQPVQGLGASRDPDHLLPLLGHLTP